jgi:2-methylcitrate dehydratase PrpD
MTSPRADHPLQLRDALQWLWEPGPLPEEVDVKARLMLLDTVGCILAGRTAPEVAQAEANMSALETGSFSFPGGRRLSSSAASTVGAMAATWDEACEGSAYAHGRPGVPVIAALLPLALTRNASLGGFVRALVAGYEVGARLGAWLRIRPGMHVDANWPALGVAAAVSHLFGMSEEATFNAINIAGCQLPASLYLPVTEGATARNTYLAHAAWLGTLGALSAQSAMGAPAQTLPHYAHGHAVASLEPLAPPGRFLILESYLKPFAAVRHVHYGAQAALDIRREIGGKTDAITSIRLSVYDEARTYCGNRAPAAPLQGQFSLSFGVAAGLRFGVLDSSVYRQPRFDDPELRRLEALVHVEPDSRIPARGARLRVESDRKNYESRVNCVKGDPALPWSSEEVVAKFMRYAAGAVGLEKAMHFAGALLQCEPETGLRPVWDTLF